MNTNLLLDLLPHRDPFRFVDNVKEVDEKHIVCSYTLRPSSAFYSGHFPGNPLTPGVIVLEAAAQAGVVLHGLYLLEKEGGSPGKHHLLFTDAEVSWHSKVAPGETLTTTGELLTWRRRRIRSRVVAHGSNGKLMFSGVLGGMGVML